MRTTKYFKVSVTLAKRAGVADVRYRTSDGMMIISEQDIRAVRLEPEEYLTGVVTAVLTEEEAKALIAEGGRQLGTPVETPTETLDQEMESQGTVSQMEEPIMEEPENQEAAEETGATEPIKEESNE